MSIKGTLETFNLCELLQMLAFNQKEGTLVLDGETGARTIFLDRGQLTFLEQDEALAGSLLRLAHFHGLADAATLAGLHARAAEEARGLGTLLAAEGLTDDEQLQYLQREAVLEQLFECQLTSVAGFEFVEGKALLPDRSEGTPTRPLHAVESVLLDLARMLDHWDTTVAVVPGEGEIYEGTGIAVDLSEHEDIDPDLADVVIPLIDGRRSLAQIAEATHASTFAVMQVAAVLYEGGGIRAVPTEDLVRRAEDLLARGEAAATVSLFQRCLDRGDASLEVRLRLADALEASGRPEDAAAELDTFAALSEDDDAPTVFDALTRALRLRGGDLATAARTCDYYLRRRPWLQDYRHAAEKALRELITAATTAGRPADAAVRLQGFIEAGDAPSEDRQLLADLYAAGGARKEAADALYQRAEDLLAVDRTSPARQLLRRALELDPGHADARRRKMELEGVRRRRGHRARIALILLALGGVASAAGVAWLGYRDHASTELVDAKAMAVAGFDDAEARAHARIDAFAQHAQAIEAEGSEDPGLEDAAATMRKDVEGIMAETAKVLDAYRVAINGAQAVAEAERHREDLERMHSRAKAVARLATQTVNDLASRGRTALKEAHVLHTDGRFLEAAARLRASWSLAFADPTVRADAKRKLAIVDAYVARHDEVRREMDELTEAGDVAGAFAKGVTALRELLDSELTKTLAFPVRVTSDPEGASVWLGDEDTGLRTPCILRYSPLVDDPSVRLRMGGRTPAVSRLPTFDRIQRDPDSLEGYEPAVHATLTPGARWRLTDDQGGFRALWAGDGMPLVAGSDGRRRLAVDARDGTLTALGSVDATRDGIRMAGRFRNGVEWELTGHRTLTVRPRRTPAWEQVAPHRVNRVPVLVGDRIVLVDEAGVVYAFRVEGGTPIWRVELGAAPTQAPQVCALGILVATNRGGAFRIDPQDGSTADLVPAAQTAALALPWGTGAVVLGGGPGGCRTVDADGVVRVLGDARPDPTLRPWAGAEGVAWIGADGKAYVLPAGASAPVEARGLGSRLDALGGGGDMLFGATADGHLRAVRLTTPERAVWSAPLGGRAASTPLRIERGVYVLVGERLVAFDA